MIIDVRDVAFAARPDTPLDGNAVARLPPVVVALATTACEVGLTTALVRSGLGPTAVLANHIALCLLVGGLAVRSAHRPGEAAAALAHLALWTFVAGPFGSLLAIGLVALDERTAERAADRQSDFGTWMEAQGRLDPPDAHRRLCNALLDGRLRIENASAVVALGDVLASGDKAGKFEALAIIGRRFDPSLTHVIRAAIKDADPSVRVLASTVLAKLQTRFTRELIALQATASQAPGDAPGWLALARARRAYAESGLIEPSQARSEMIDARIAAQTAVAAAPLNVDAHALLAEIVHAFGAPGDDLGPQCTLPTETGR